MSEFNMEAVQAAPNGRAIVVFGRDGAGKPHASCFDEAQAELAEKAASLMGMHVLRLETAEARNLGAKLPQGRVFPSGRAFVPFVKAALYGSLAAIVASPGPHKGERSDAVEPAEGQPNPDPDALAVGTVVLAWEGPGMGWWEAVVLRTQGNSTTLRWRDYPDMAPIARRRDHLAYLPPGMEPG